jgi:hypothetical protein
MSAKIIMWLGYNATEGAAALASLRAVEKSSEGAKRETQRHEQFLSNVHDDRQLLDDTLALFETAFAYFKKDGNRTSQQIIDQLAVSVITRLRLYLMSGQS